MYVYDVMYYENWIIDGSILKKKKIDIKVEIICIKFYILWFGKI